MEEHKRSDSDLEAIGTKEERERWIERFKEYFYEKAENAYHYILNTRYDIPFMVTCKKLKLQISGFWCNCLTENRVSHQHYIVWIPNPRNVKHPQSIVSHKMSQVMYSMKISRAPEDHTCLYGQKIQSRAKLLNLVLFVMTADIKGWHKGALVDCKHSGPQTLIPDEATINKFLREEVNVAITDYEKERTTEWEQYKEETDPDNVEEFLLLHFGN